MLIALPNQDCSFTLTLFMPKEMFDELTNECEVIEFFEKYFVDALELMGR
jgi:kynurenine 3-monooxygenase